MNSTVDILLNETNLQLAYSPSYNLTKTYHEDDTLDWSTTLPFVIRLVTYFTVLVLLVVVVVMIMKFLSEFEEHMNREESSSSSGERNPLMTAKTMDYGSSYCGEDIEYGSCSNANCNTTSSSYDQLDIYDGKICVICFDDQRNCFFVPCGHCATCYVCAHRIFNEESKTCPVCRRSIRKVRKLFAT